jgi:ribokinase
MGRVVVVGSTNMDVLARAPHHPAVGETVLGSDLRFAPGGKGANQAVAAARLGAPTALVGRVGADAFGDTLVHFLGAEGVDLSAVRRSPDAPTGTALIVVAGADNTIVVVPGANAAMTPADLDGVRFDAGDVVVAQQEIPLDVVRAAFERAKQSGAITLLNPAPALPAGIDLLALVDIVVLNELELAGLTAGPVPTSADEATGLAGQLQRHGPDAVVATLGADGAVALAGSQRIREMGRAVEPVDSTGAGDCFVGALAARLAAGDPMGRAMHIANVAASLSVQRFGAGTSMPTLAEVTEAARAAS